MRNIGRSYLANETGALAATSAIFLSGLTLLAASVLFLDRAAAIASQPYAASDPATQLDVAIVHYSQPVGRYATGSGSRDVAWIRALGINELLLNPLVLGTMPTFIILGTASWRTLEGEAGIFSN